MSTDLHDGDPKVPLFQLALARRLGLLLVPASLLIWAWFVLPHSAEANETAIVGLLAVSLVIGVGSLLARVPEHRYGVALVLAFATVQVSTGLYLSGSPHSVYLFFYFWYLPVAFGFLPLRQAQAQLAFGSVGLAAALVALDAPLAEGALTWSAVAIAVLAMGSLVRALSASADKAESHYRRVFEDSPTAMGLASLDLRILQVNAAFCAFVGRTERDVVGRRVAELGHPDDLALSLENHRALMAGERSHYQMEKRYLRPDGTQMWGQLTASLVQDERGRPRAVHAQIEDISMRREAAEVLDRRARHGEAAAELGRIALSATDVTELAQRTAEVVTERVDVESCVLLEVSGDELYMLASDGPTIGKVPGDRWSMRPRSLGALALAHDGPLVIEDLHAGPVDVSKELLASGVRAAVAVAVDGRDGPTGIVVAFSTSPRSFSDEDVHFLHVVANVLGSAIERTAREADAIHRALHDSLTGLPNRDLFADRLALTLARARRGAPRPAVLVANLDQFKRINDSLGHQAGDELLRALAPRLARVVRETDTVARFGGDEFVVLCDGVDGEHQAMGLARRIALVLEEPVVVAGAQVHVTASIGVAVAGPNSDAEGLVHDADAALYRAKARGRGRCELFDAPMHAKAMARLELETGLRRALAGGEMAMHYQPVVELSTGRTLAYEALMRWARPEHGPVSPGEFIPIAEDSGLIVPLGRWALHEACTHAASLGPDGPPVSVNLSARQVARREVVEDVAGALRASGLPPERLWLEITESALLEEADSPLPALHALRALGVRLVLDDFGTGYSSLAYLQKFPLDALKIDRAFITDMTHNARSASLVEAVVAMARSLGLTVIPEGIETADQRDALLALGCRYGQGYLFGRPAPAQDLASPVAVA